ncbi:hypothetical protein GCM10022403_052180 [Streptomyces coacervatus]|uniref:Uncharacterized protein n=1 Tax=Streptomyces coacervatus TaxID=647381 RepID=A0ABP7I850_9ACTN
MVVGTAEADGRTAVVQGQIGAGEISGHGGSVLRGGFLGMVRRRVERIDATLRILPYPHQARFPQHLETETTPSETLPFRSLAV